MKGPRELPDDDPMRAFGYDTVLTTRHIEGLAMNHAISDGGVATVMIRLDLGNDKEFTFSLDADMALDVGRNLVEVSEESLKRGLT